MGFSGQNGKTRFVVPSKYILVDFLLQISYAIDERKIQLQKCTFGLIPQQIAPENRYRLLRETAIITRAR